MRSAPSRGLLIAVLLVLPCVALASGQLRLGQHDFDWTDSEQELAHFKWSAVVINGTASAVDVRVSVDLLDDDDRVVHTDSVRHAAAAGSEERVEHTGSLAFDKAVDVVSFRFRVDPIDED